MKKNPLDHFFRPASVAVIGASVVEKSIGHTLVQNLLCGGFPGRIYPINPKYKEVLGLEAFPGVGDVDDRIDLAIIAIPIKAIPEYLGELGRAKIPAAIIVSTGGREIGPEGVKVEAAIKDAAREAGVRYLGPNAMGLMCPPRQLNASLLSHPVIPGNLAFISQSGAMCSSVLGWATLKNIGFSHFISVGSKTDLDFGDLIDYLGNQVNVKSIVMYMESLDHHRKFMSAARSVSRVRPIILMKGGRSPAGSQASARHTGVESGEDAAYDAAFRRAGIIRAETISQLFDCAEALGKVSMVAGGEVGIITNAGGLGVLAADALSRWQMEPAPLTAETLAKLDEILPPMWSRANPLDIQDDATPERYAKTVRLLMKAPEIAGLVIILSPQAETDAAGAAQAVVQEAGGKGKAVFAVWMGGQDVAEGVRLLNAAGIPTFDTPEAAVDTFMEMYSYSRHLELLQETPPRLPADLRINTRQAKSFIEHCLERDARILTELESKAILSAYGIPVNRTVAASTRQDAAMVAKEIGFPVLLKVNSPDASYRMEPAGVRFHLDNEDEVVKAFDEMVTEARASQPEAYIIGVTVQAEEKRPDLELFIKVQRDKDFGPLIYFGLGGVLTRVAGDWALDLPPLNLLMARLLMQKTRVYQILQDSERFPLAILDELAKMLVRVSQLITDFPEIQELEINPVLLTGNRVVAADARLVLEESAVRAPRHLLIAPYPNQYESDWMLRDGSPVLLRPMKPEDEPLVYDFLHHKCSENTIYFRYFKLIRKFTHEMLIRFTQNDYDREIGLMAIGQPPGPEVMMGVSRLVMEPDREAAEFAVIVGDPYQGKGLGPKLVERIIDIAREQGVKLLSGEVLAENQPMLEMVKRLGFTLKREEEGKFYRIEMAL
jgi:acetyltransferase